MGAGGAAVTGAGERAGQRRSWLVRAVALVVARDPGTHPPGLVGWLLTRCGRDPDRAGYATGCRQCGQWESVSVFRLGPRRARYWCQRCGAVVRLPDRAALRPVDQLRDQPAAAAVPAPRPAGSAGPGGPAGPDGAGLAEVMPAAMRRWALARSRRPLTLDRLDKSTVYQLYREWDARPDAGAALPAFSVVVGALHECCYHTDLAGRGLAGGEEVAGPLAERLEHARRWLALRGRELCWIHSRVPAGGLAEPDPAAVRAAIAALRAGERPDPVAARAARAAAFGTDGGPGLPALLRVYPAGELLAALAGYLASGARPLRADVLARLAAPLADLADLAGLADPADPAGAVDRPAGGTDPAGAAAGGDRPADG